MLDIAPATYHDLVSRVRCETFTVDTFALWNWATCPHLDSGAAQQILTAAWRATEPSFNDLSDDQRAGAAATWQQSRFTIIEGILQAGAMPFEDEKGLIAVNGDAMAKVIVRHSRNHEWVAVMVRRGKNLAEVANRNDLDGAEFTALWERPDLHLLLANNKSLPVQGVQAILKGGSTAEVQAVMGAGVRADTWPAIRTYVLGLLRRAPDDGHTALVVGRLLQNSSVRLDHKTAVLNAMVEAVGGQAPFRGLMQKHAADTMRRISEWLRGPEGPAFQHGGGLSRHGVVC